MPCRVSVMERNSRRLLNELGTLVLGKCAFGEQTTASCRCTSYSVKGAPYLRSSDLTYGFYCSPPTPRAKSEKSGQFSASCIASKTLRCTED